MATERPRCTHPGCDKASRSAKGGLCSKHYQQQWRAERVAPPCTVQGCWEPVQARDLCATHYQRVKAHGTTDLPDRLALKPDCTVNGCDKPVQALGLCGTHYHQARRADQTRPTCAEPDCDKPSYAKGLCPTHYNRIRRIEGAKR